MNGLGHNVYMLMQSLLHKKFHQTVAAILICTKREKRKNVYMLGTMGVVTCYNVVCCLQFNCGIWKQSIKINI